MPVTPAGTTRKAPPRESPGRPLDPEISDRILAATLEILEAEGFSGTCIEAVAHQAGVHKPAIYRRWSSKVDLVVAAVRSISPDVVDPATGDVRADLVSLLQAAVRSVNDPHVRVGLHLLAEVSADDELSKVVSERIVGPRRAVARTVLERGVAAGQLRDDVDLDLIGDLLFGTIHSRVLMRRRPLARRHIEHIVDIVLTGAGAG
jgi:AcrR family transcriptional regulator